MSTTLTPSPDATAQTLLLAWIIHEQFGLTRLTAFG